MNAERLMAHYEEIAEAPDAVARLRRFILSLAVRGKLTPQDDHDGPAVILDPSLPTNVKPPFQAPSSWSWSRLKALGSLRGGGTPSKARDDFWNGSIPWVSPKDMKVDYIADAQLRITAAAVEGSAVNLIAPQSILFVVRGMILAHSFPVAISRVPLAINQDMKAVVLKRPAMAEYLLRALKGLKPEMLKKVQRSSHGTCRLEGGDYADFLVPIPPFPEQSRIVAKVDELMALCDELEAARATREAARDRLAAASFARLNAPSPDTFQADARFALDVLPTFTARPDQIEHLRRAVAGLAVRGKLVPQDRNDEPASQILARIVAAKAALPGARRGGRSVARPRAAEFEFSVPAGWALTTLGEVATKITDGAHKTPTYVDAGVPFVSIKDFSGGKLDLSNTRFITEAEHRELYRRCNPRRGDILLGRIGTLGRATLVDTDLEFSLFVSVALIQYDQREIAPEYLRLFLNSPLAEGEFDRIKIGGGTHTNKLNLSDLHTIAFAVPPRPEQDRIVTKVHALLAICDELEAGLHTAERGRRRLLDALLAEALAPAAQDLEAA